MISKMDDLIMGDTDLKIILSLLVGPRSKRSSLGPCVFPSHDRHEARSTLLYLTASAEAHRCTSTE